MKVAWINDEKSEKMASSFINVLGLLTSFPQSSSVEILSFSRFSAASNKDGAARVSSNFQLHNTKTNRLIIGINHDTSLTIRRKSKLKESKNRIDGKAKINYRNEFISEASRWVWDLYAN